MAVVTWFCIYPVLNLVLFVLGPYIRDLPQLLATFFMTILLVPLMGILISTAQERFKGWLAR